MSDLQVGEARLVLHSGPPPFRSILFVRVPEGVRAYWNVCQHLPVPLDGGTMIPPIEEGQLVCNTHGAKYRLDDGYCVTGPCSGFSLHPLPVEIQDDVAFAEVGEDGGPLPGTEGPEPG